MNTQFTQKAIQMDIKHKKSAEPHAKWKQCKLK